MKRTALLLVVLASACKTTDSAPTPSASDPAPTANVRPQKRGPAPSLAPDQAAHGVPGDDELASHPRRERSPKDLDGDGKVSPEERAAAHRERTERIRAKWDANGDGKLTVEEVAAVDGGMRFPDPAALDLDKDGDISAAELNASMEARRLELHAQRLGRGRGSGGSDAPRAEAP
ncbi:hypothetical protein BH11MYX1_BH11MYX1_53000 [soil metagenome]